MNNRFCFLLAGIFLLGACRSDLPSEPALQIIPQPKEVGYGEGTLLLDAAGYLTVRDSSVTGCGELLNKTILGMTNYSLSQEKQDRRGTVVCLGLNPALQVNSEGYRLSIKKDSVVIVAPQPAGVFYGVQTFIQLLTDAQFFDPVERSWTLPALQITDEPAFAYRGLHFDVSRHFFPKEFVLKCIDLMSEYKLNHFHWHLTDAAGWRIEMKKYPELTEKAAWRSQSEYLKWWKGDRRYVAKDSVGAYGGYYTQEDIREVVAYAASRQVTVIPEIEMPGHSEEVLAVYPQLGCTGKPYRNGEFCIGNEETFEFVENVLTEVLELFPSEYIHIGGDEAGKGAWKKCPKCQKRIREEHLNDEKGLQSYMIHRVGKFLKTKGRKLIGWDEILEGGLAPDAHVMSWRGEKGGIEAARSGHYVVMTPGIYCYFDSYQADPETQPYAIGGFTPYLKVYAYDPVPADLKPEEAKYILGAQANVWTEYIPTASHAEYMIFPRLLALSEVVWTPKEKKEREDFKRRVEKHVSLLRQRGVNAFPLSDRVDILTEVDTIGKRIKISFDTEKYRPEIRYTTDGQEPSSVSSIYETPFYVSDSVEIKAAIFRGEERSGTMSDMRVDYHKAIGKKVSYRTRYSGSYPAAGEWTLVDGYRGGLTYSDGRWQGFLTNIDVIVDLDSVRDLSYVSARFMQLTGPGVYMPDYVTVSLSEDGKEFKEVARVKNDVSADVNTLVLRDFTARFKGRGRYIGLFAKKQRGFQFIDEIVVY